MAASFALALLATSPAALATENGLINFPAGAITTYAGFLPAPGATELYGYLLAYNATSFRDNSGHPVPGLRGLVFAQAPRIVHSWKPAWGPFTVSSGIVVQSLYAKIVAGTQRDEAVGVDLIGLEPVDLTTSVGNWHFMMGPEIYIPIGAYHPDRLSNTSNHYFAVVPEFGLTWTPTPAWDLSLNTVVEFNMRNNATDYRSGDVWQLNYGLGYRPFAGHQQWEVGLSGYYETQFTDDTLHGAHVPTGFHLRKNAVGPKVDYWFTQTSAIVLMYTHEMAVRNAFKGDLYWVEFAFGL